MNVKQVHKPRLSGGRRVLVAFTASTLVSVLLAVAVFTQWGGGALDQGGRATFWEKKIRQCQELSNVSSPAVEASAGSCFADLLYTALSGGDIGVFAAAAAPITAQDQALNAACHAPTHGLGQRIVDHFDNDWRAALSATAWDMCDSGAMHGVYDVWGQVQHDEKEWLALSAICTELMTVRVTGCPDAIGHAAYESVERNINAALRICSLLKVTEYGRDCAGGVIMQHYNPNNPLLTAERGYSLPGPDQWSQMEELCFEAARDATMTPGVLTGCKAGVGWIMGIYISLRADLRSSGVEQADVEPVSTVELTKAAAQRCDELQPRQLGAADCLDNLFRHPPLAAAFSAETIRDFCLAVSDGDIAGALTTTCLGSAVARMPSSEVKRLVQQLPAVGEYAVQSGLGFKLD